MVENVKKLRDTKPEPVDIPELAEPLKPEPQKPGLFNKKKILAQNAEAERNYQKDLLEYHILCQKRLEEIKQIERLRKEEHRAAIAEAEQEVEASRRELETLRAAAENYTIKKPAEACPEKAKQQMINNEIEQAEGLLKRIYQTRNQLYSANIVFGKYRDLVALATFYEYLMAGRCAELEGRDGAYNLYESEIRANLIISKLTDIEKSLKKIEQSQYMICSQLSEMNRTLDRINDTMGAAYTAIMDIRTNSKDMKEYMAHIAQNTKVMAHNTAVTAYYSKINAELTNALGFMVALK